MFERLGDDISPPEMDWADSNAMAAVLLPLHGAPDAPRMTITMPQLDPTDLDPLIELLQTVRVGDVDQAQALVDAAGGTDHLLDRLYAETAWATRPNLGEFEGEAAVFSDLRMIHHEVQPDIREAAVEYCARLGAVAPRANRLVCNAIWADGQPAGIGDYALAPLRLNRTAVTPDATVAWNRAQSRAITRLTATGTATRHATSLAAAIREIAEWVDQAGDFYCRQTRPDAKWLALLQIRKLLTSFVEPPPVESAPASPLSAGALAGHDNVHGFVTGLERLMSDLTDGVSDKPHLIAARTADLAQEALNLQDPTVWRNAAEPPIEALKVLETTLHDIRAVLGDASNDPMSRQTAALQFGTVSRRHSVLRRAAERARERADLKALQTRETIRVALAAHQVTATVVSIHCGRFSTPRSPPCFGVSFPYLHGSKWSLHMADPADVTAMTADIVAAYVEGNKVSADQLPGLISTIHAALKGAGRPTEAEVEAAAAPTAAQVRKSITDDGLVSFVDGQKYKTLKRHLTANGLTFADYKLKFGLPANYPLEPGVNRTTHRPPLATAL